MSHQSNTGSVTARLHRLADGDNEAEAWLVDRYFERICSLAKQQLGASPRGAHDEEDVALTVMRNFLEAAKAGTFQRLKNRDDLDQILAMLTRRKAIDYYRKATRRQKYEVGESFFGDGAATFAVVAGFEPPRDLIDEMAESIRQLFQGIAYENLKLEQIAIRRLKGFSVSEIATELNLLPNTVYRRLHLIRDRWRQSIDETLD